MWTPTQAAAPTNGRFCRALPRVPAAAAQTRAAMFVFVSGSVRDLKTLVSALTAVNNSIVFLKWAICLGSLAVLCVFKPGCDTENELGG